MGDGGEGFLYGAGKSNVNLFLFLLLFFSTTIFSDSLPFFILSFAFLLDRWERAVMERWDILNIPAGAILGIKERTCPWGGVEI